MMVDLQTEAAFLLLAACCSEAGGLVLAPLQSSHGAVRIWPCTAVAMAWHNAALRLLCGRGWQTPQPPPGAGGGASRPVRAAEARAGARARGDETSLQPSPARNRAGGWCDMSRTRPRASSPFDLMLTRWLARCGAVLGIPAPGDGLFPGKGVSLQGRADRWLSNAGWSSSPWLTCSGRSIPASCVHFHQHLLTVYLFYFFFLVGKRFLI